MKKVKTIKEVSKMLDEWQDILNEYLFDGWLPEVITVLGKTDWDDADGERPIASVTQHEGDSINTYTLILDPDYIRELGSSWETIALFLHHLVHVWQIERSDHSWLFHNDEFFYKALSCGLWFDEREATDIAIIDPLIGLFEERGLGDEIGEVRKDAKIYGMRGELVYEGRYVLTAYGKTTE